MRPFEISKKFRDMLEAPEYTTATVVMQKLWVEHHMRRRERELQDAIGEEGCGPVFAALIYPTA